MFILCATTIAGTNVSRKESCEPRGGSVRASCVCTQVKVMTVNKCIFNNFKLKNFNLKSRKVFSVLVVFLIFGPI